MTWGQGLAFAAICAILFAVYWFAFHNPPDIHNDQGPGDGWPGPQ